jgi:DNA replicative helicase MCM subunit Mcm2 (Cdc46/Mcm family)
MDRLVSEYVDWRQWGVQGNDKTIAFTPRQLEGLIRLAEAHARMK